ncbi:hypothetical protein BH24ACI1_BH24ACI1_00380 [soil metagenome]|jgi:hypothetical protein
MIQKIPFLFCFVFVTCFQVSSFGQEFDETGLAADAIIIRQSNVREKPSAKSANLETLSPNAEIRVIDTNRVNGYLRVLYGDGEQGYVYYKNVNLPQEFLRMKRTDSLLAARADEPCITTGFQNCPARGCYQPNSPGALFNEAKRRSSIGANPVNVSFADLQTMQNEIGNRLGIRSQNKQLSAQERAQLRNISITDGTVGESSLIKIAGYVPFSGNGLKEGSIETVNCKFTETEERDIHIPLAAQSSSIEYEGIVIEMIPQNRPTEWNLQKLKTVRNRKKKVMVIGGLFYDNEHLVNKNPARPLNGHSKRFSIWEIHPVIQFFVCSRVDNSCHPSSMSGWVTLEIYR